MSTYRRHTTSNFFAVFFLVSILQKYRHALLQISSSALVTPRGFHETVWEPLSSKKNVLYYEGTQFFFCWNDCIWMLRNLNLLFFVTCHWQVAAICDRTGERGHLRDSLRHGTCSIWRRLINLHETSQDQLRSTHETHYAPILRNGASV